ncbi:MAG TPA: hypothetical protein VK456_05320 [Xanthobacteraceae bacterium]|nr:hypothetical protein [Xanthobacteraceae bacterium]
MTIHRLHGLVKPPSRGRAVLGPGISAGSGRARVQAAALLVER